MIKKHIPNLITLLNLLCGGFAILTAFSGYLVMAAYFIGLAALLDFLDGFAARLFNAYSDFGKQLDTLADLISFGFAPAVIMYQLLLLSNNVTHYYLAGVSLPSLVALLITVFSALRLAKFNIDSRQTNAFIGLPTPANALFFASLPLVIIQSAHQQGFFSQIIIKALSNYYFLAFLICFMCFLLISELRLFALKFQTYRWHDNKWRYIFLAGAAISVLLFSYKAIPLIIFFYVLLSLIIGIFDKPHHTN